MKTIFTIIIVLSVFFCNGESKSTSHGKYTYIKKEYTLNKDGSSSYTYSSSLELLTYDAFHKLYGESFIVYNPNYQTLKINNSTTTMRDGKKVKSPQNAFNEVLPSFAANAPAYNVLREMVVSHTGLEVGAKIDFSYTINTDKSYEKPFCQTLILAESSPVDSYTVVVKVPKSMKLNEEQWNIPERVNKSTDKDYDVYTWVLKNVPTMNKDRNNVYYLNDYPTISFSTMSLFSDWYTFNESSIENLNIITDNLKPTDTELKKSYNTAEYIVNNINTNNIPLSFQYKNMKRPDDVILTNSGTPIEKTNLLSAALSAEGIDNDIVAAVPKRFSKILNVNNIHEFFVAMKGEDKKVYLLSAVKPNEENYINSLNSFDLVIVSENDSKTMLLDKINAKSFIYAKFTNKLISSVKYDGISTITLKYASVPMNFSKSTPADEILKYVSKPISNATCNDFKNDSKADDISISFKYAKNDSINKKSHGYQSISLPTVKGGIDDFGINGLSAERTTPYPIKMPITEHYEYTFNVPSGIKILNSNLNIEKKYDFGTIEIKYEFKKDVLIVKRSIVITNDIITPSQYNNFAEMMSIWNNPNYKTVYLK